MVKIELTKEEIDQLIVLMDASQVSMGLAEKAAALYKKFKDAKDI